MQTEIEVKFPQIDIDVMRERLKEAGAVCEQPMRLMRRRTFDNNFMKQGKDAFARVRDEGHKITMTYKQFDSLSLHGAKEIEIEVSDFEKACELMFQIGAGEVASSYQESRRETWQLGDVEIMIDEWPWLKPYIEIEGAHEEAVRKVAKKLGCDWDDAVFGDVMAAFRLEYPHLTVGETIGNLEEVRFGAPLPDFLKG